MLYLAKSKYFFSYFKKNIWINNFKIFFYRNVIFDDDYDYESLLDEDMEDFDEDAYLERLGRFRNSWLF